MSIEALKKSNAWDVRFDLPLVPHHNNPHIYLGFVFRILGANALPMWPNAYAYIAACEVEEGYITRWPLSDDTSHDELMGAAFIAPQFAERAIAFITKRDGHYCLENPPIEKSNVYRFIFLMPFLKACAGYHVSTLSQVLFSAHVLHSAFFVKPGETSGILKIWLMAGKMREYPICKGPLWIWSWRWTRRGFTPKTIFTKYYLKDCPIFSQLAKDTYE